MVHEVLRYMIKKNLGSSDETDGQGAVRNDSCVVYKGSLHSAVTEEFLDYHCSW